MPRRHCQRSRALLMPPLREHLLGLGNGFCRIQFLRASLCAVHDRVAAIQTKRILELVEALAGRLVTAVDEPTVCGQQRSRPEIAIAVPPVARATRRAAGTEYAGRRLVDEFLVFLAL